MLTALSYHQHVNLNVNQNQSYSKYIPPSRTARAGDPNSYTSQKTTLPSSKSITQVIKSAYRVVCCLYVLTHGTSFHFALFMRHNKM